MRRIRRRDTKPELMLRSELHRRGRRFRVDVPGLPGRPDVVFPKSGLAVFVHGCFWHRHTDCPEASRPKTNSAYWEAKLTRNVQRDVEHVVALEKLGYMVAIFWECEIEENMIRAADTVESILECANKLA